MENQFAERFSDFTFCTKRWNSVKTSVFYSEKVILSSEKFMEVMVFAWKNFALQVKPQEADNLQSG